MKIECTRIDRFMEVIIRLVDAGMPFDASIDDNGIYKIRFRETVYETASKVAA